MLLFADGFEHYGSDELNALDGVYAHFGQTLSNAQAATGSYSAYMNVVSPQFSNTSSIRKVLPAAKDKLGMTARFYFPTLPGNSTRSVIAGFLTPDISHGHVVCAVDSQGALCFYQDYSFSEFIGYTNARNLIAQTDPIIVASAWNHVEIQVYTHATAGWIRVAVNGVHVMEETGLNTSFDAGATQIASVCQTLDRGGSAAGPDDYDFWMDDYILYDFEGDSGVDTDFCPAVDGGTGVALSYIGELQCIYLAPNGNTAEDDWAKSTGASAFDLVDERDPNDVDYIYSTAVNDLTELDLEDLPPEITYIRGVMLIGRMSKSDAGACFIKYGMDSAGVDGDADERPVTVEPTYWWDFMNVDPNSGVRWTRPSLNAAKFRISRSL